MKKQLAEVVDGTEIKETTEQEILYSCENNGAKDMCSSENDATRGNGLSSVEKTLILCRLVGLSDKNAVVFLEVMISLRKLIYPGIMRKEKVLWD